MSLIPPGQFWVLGVPTASHNWVLLAGEALGLRGPVEAGTKGLWHLFQPGPPGNLTGRQGASRAFFRAGHCIPPREDFWWPSAGGMKVPGPASRQCPSPGCWPGMAFLPPLRRIRIFSGTFFFLSTFSRLHTCNLKQNFYSQCS